MRGSRAAPIARSPSPQLSCVESGLKGPLTPSTSVADRWNAGRVRDRAERRERTPRSSPGTASVETKDSFQERNDACTWRSLPSFKSYVWGSIITCNLLVGYGSGRVIVIILIDVSPSASRLPRAWNPDRPLADRRFADRDSKCLRLRVARDEHGRDHCQHGVSKSHLKPPATLAEANGVVCCPNRHGEKRLVSFGVKSFRIGCFQRHDPNRTSRLQVMMESHTYDLKEGNERHVHRSRPKTRFKNEMTPSIPQRNRRRR